MFFFLLAAHYLYCSLTEEIHLKSNNRDRYKIKRKDLVNVFRNKMFCQKQLSIWSVNKKPLTSLVIVIIIDVLTIRYSLYVFLFILYRPHLGLRITVLYWNRLWCVIGQCWRVLKLKIKMNCISHERVVMYILFERTVNENENPWGYRLGTVCGKRICHWGFQPGSRVHQPLTCPNRFSYEQTSTSCLCEITPTHTSARQCCM
jgi:hypothetical protein